MDAKWVCHYEPESERLSMEWKHSDSPVKKTFQVQHSVKKVMLTVSLGTKGHMSFYFFANSVSYC